jgi:transposase-like protein
MWPSPQYLNNVIEQDHRPIKQRYYPMRGFGSFAAAARFCTAHEELRAYLRPNSRCNEAVSLADQRRLCERRWSEVCLRLAAG